MSVVSKTKDISSYFAKGKAAQAMSGVIESAIAATGADAGSRAKRGVINSASSPAEPNLKKAKKSEPEVVSASVCWLMHGCLIPIADIIWCVPCGGVASSQTNTSLDEVKVAVCDGGYDKRSSCSECLPRKTILLTPAVLCDQDAGLQQLPALSAAEVTYENMHRTLPASWHSVLAPEFTKSYYREMVSFLVKEEASGAKIFPPRHLVCSVRLVA